MQIAAGANGLTCFRKYEGIRDFINIFFLGHLSCGSCERFLTVTSSGANLLCHRAIIIQRELAYILIEYYRIFQSIKVERGEMAEDR